MPFLAAIPLLVSFAASDRGSYQFEPWDGIRPSWEDPLMDSLKSGGSVSMFAERRLPDGTISGRDTMRTTSVPTGRHSRSIWWNFQKDTTRHVQDSWLSAEGELDSLTEESFRHDSSTSWTQIGKRKIPGGEARWVDYGPMRTSRIRIDSFYTFFDSEGRIIARRTLRRIQASGAASGTPYDQFGSLQVDSIEWSSDGKPVRWRSFDSSRSFTSRPFSIRREVHELTWDGFRLVRDSSRTWMRTESGDTIRDSSTLALRWDGPRLLDYATWNEKGLPLTRTSARVTTFWSWDSLGRMTRLREWGTETDLDSLVYGKGPWPERRLIHSCANTEPFDVDPVTYELTPTKDDCKLEETVLYTYAVEKSARVEKRSLHHPIVRIVQGTISIAGLGREARTATLLSPSGSILRRTIVSDGAASMPAPQHAGVGLWVVQDAHGAAMASGRIALP